MQSDALKRTRSGKLDRQTTEKLGQLLRDWYKERLKEDVPDHLVDLVKRFDKGGGEGSRS
jgi:predicted metal-dependent hydrolase